MLDRGQVRADTQTPSAPGDLGEGQPHIDTHRRSALADSYLLICADALDDLERTRIATAGRLRALTTTKGLGGSPEEKRVLSLLDGIGLLEAHAIRELRRALRAHPLGPFIARTVGLGEKQVARLLAEIGDPADRPNPAKLWQYCGHGDPQRSRLRKGQAVEFSPTAKMRTHLIAQRCMMQRHSPYREVYDRERARWANRDTSDLHKHNHALRVVGKAILLDLWREARRVRDLAGANRVSAPIDAAPPLSSIPVEAA